jgi:phosphate transport system substrate-binding protein
MATITQEAIERFATFKAPSALARSRAHWNRGTVLRVDGHYPTDADYPLSVVLALIHLNTLQDRDALAFLRFADTPQAADIITLIVFLPSRARQEPADASALVSSVSTH